MNKSEKTPNAEEFFNTKCIEYGINHDDQLSEWNVLNMLREFAKLYVTEALTQVLKNHYLMIDGVSEKSNGKRYIVCEKNHYTETEIEIDPLSILNAYNLDSIK